MTKRCTACGEVKSLDDFYFIQKRKTHHVYCQPCNLEYQRQYREKNAEQSKVYKRQYYLDHREEIGDDPDLLIAAAEYLRASR